MFGWPLENVFDLPFSQCFSLLVLGLETEKQSTFWHP